MFALPRQFRDSIRALILLSSFLATGCGNNDDAPSEPVFVSGAPETNGIFDAALTQGSDGLWMSYSTVNVLSSDPTLMRINTRIASSSNAGNNWRDIGIVLNSPSTIQVPDNQNASTQAVWQYEVSRLLYDPYAPANLRWKLFWHRYPQANRPSADRLFKHGWIGVMTAASPTGPWSNERKFLVGSVYDPATAAIIGAPENTSASLSIADCPIITEPGALATAAGVYISIKCADGNADRVVLLRCSSELTNCVYRGNVVLNTEAQQFARTGQTYNGFSATEMVTVAGIHYLMVTPTQMAGAPTPSEQYRGCLVFQIANLEAAATAPILERVGGSLSGAPVLKRSLSGSSGSFNGACGYSAAATSSGIIYGEIQTQGNTARFGLYRSRVNLP